MGLVKVKLVVNMMSMRMTANQDHLFYKVISVQFLKAIKIFILNNSNSKHNDNKNKAMTLTKAKTKT